MNCNSPNLQLQCAQIMATCALNRIFCNQTSISISCGLKSGMAQAVHRFGRRARCAPLNALRAGLLAPWQPARASSHDQVAATYLRISKPPPLPLLKAPYHTGTVLWSSLSKDLAGIAGLQGCRLVCVSSFHMGAVRAQSAKSKKPKGGGEHESVLTQFVGKAEEPKQVTVATKGQKQCIIESLLCVCVHGVSFCGNPLPNAIWV